jgi:hypothetical protein
MDKDGKRSGSNIRLEEKNKTGKVIGEGGFLT